MKRKILAWHFCGEKLRDGRDIPPDGETIKHDGELILCAKGFHASIRIIDALSYAPGNTICRVSCGGNVIKSNDKLACSERTVLWRVSGESVLRKFACQQALSVAHLWNMPPVVKEYLETQNEELRDASWDAARAATWDATWAATWDASWDASWDATWAATWAAAWAAARAAAWAAARAATRDAANTQLTKMVKSEHRKLLKTK